MDKRAEPSLLAVLVLGYQAGQDLISRGRGNNGLRPAQSYWELGRTTLFYLNIQDEISGCFSRLSGLLVSVMSEKGHGTVLS